MSENPQKLSRSMKKIIITISLKYKHCLQATPKVLKELEYLQKDS